jgi:hypothetical protein
VVLERHLEAVDDTDTQTTMVFDADGDTAISAAAHDPDRERRAFLGHRALRQPQPVLRTRRSDEHHDALGAVSNLSET